MTSPYPSEQTIEQLFDSDSESPDGSQADSRLKPPTEIRPEPLTDMPPQPAMNGQANGRSEQPAKTSPKSLTPGQLNPKTQPILVSREIQQVVTALTGLKSELKQSGLLEKAETQNLLFQIAQFVASKAKPVDKNQQQPISINTQASFQAVDVSGLLKTSADRERAVAKIIYRIQQSLDVQRIFTTTTQELRQLLQCDRVGIYRFNDDWSGELVAESVGSGWTAVLQEQQTDASLKENTTAEPGCTLRGLSVQPEWLATDTYLKETRGGSYARGERFKRVDDIYTMNFSPCYVELLEKFQARAYLIVPIFQGVKLWGLLAAYQNSGPRRWEEFEVELLLRLSSPLGVALQQAETVAQLQAKSEEVMRAAERERAVTRLINRIRKNLDVQRIFRTTTQELRLLLQCDRVGIYRFNDDWSGEFVAESVGDGWVVVVEEQENDPSLKGDTTAEPSCTLKALTIGTDAITDTYLKDTRGGSYARGEQFKQVNDIYTAGFSACYLEVLEKYQARAYVIVPIFQGNKLWGLLAAYQNSGPRQWQEAELNVLLQLAPQLGTALQQAESVAQVNRQSEQLARIAERQSAYNKLIYRLGQRIIQQIKENSPLESMFRLATQEVRRQLKADRVAIYRFNEDWSGEFIYEDVGNAWLRLVGSDQAVVKDTYLQETQGGRYRRNESLQVDDIYSVGHSDCHIELLEQWGTKAYTLVPIFKGEQLWGLLGAYQNDQPRSWEEYEVDLLTQVAVQLSIAVQQSEALAKVRTQAQQLAESAAREKAAKEQLQQRVIQLLTAVRPVFAGDLTVRVPITEDEVGTIADAYNNTIQSLRKIVTQVQTATTKVTQTSQNSEVAIVELSQQAQKQLQQVTQALNQLQTMVNSTEAVAANAQQVEVAVQQANQTVREGDTAMNRTVDGILAIRETVAETSKKIKRLSESSQKISRVISLIGNFTTQTQLLALNASIEATRAGEYGRGFTVVADEVRSLSRQSADATKEIEKLVQEIQTEISAVATAMEMGIQQVVGGTNLVNETRQQLNAIVAATAQISQLVQGITQATQSQTQQSQLVTQVMADVAAIATKTSTDSSQISVSFQELLATAQQLQTSVGQFKVS